MTYFGSIARIQREELTLKFGAGYIRVPKVVQRDQNQRDERDVGRTRCGTNDQEQIIRSRLEI
ncbi:hypothetical protein [Paenibacillus borealis]|uniref:Uncharacterized protein n=1 Tax=Paenibacillus borealis TaxID=160799 RepID=A0A089LN69_PAEBO|nr:hypothetical protein [Paenibacillus borealis]AIQ60623.1 hypothetical protein PBOR_29525 [Paenibacillus borealis]